MALVGSARSDLIPDLGSDGADSFSITTYNESRFRSSQAGNREVWARGCLGGRILLSSLVANRGMDAETGKGWNGFVRRSGERV